MADEEVAGLVVRLAMESSSFSEGISSLNKQLKTAKSEFDLAGAGINNFGKTVDGLTAKSEYLNKAIGIQGEMVNKYKEALSRSRQTLSDTTARQAELTTRVAASRQAYEESSRSLGENAEDTIRLRDEYRALNTQYDQNNERIRRNVSSMETWQTRTNGAERSLRDLQTELVDTDRELVRQSSRWTQLADAAGRASERMKATGESMSKIGGALTTSVTLPLLAAGAASFKMASDLQENIGKAGVVFGDSANIIEKWSETAITRMGMAKSTALDMASGFGDMGSGMEIELRKNVEMSKELTQRAADLASYKNIRLDIAQTSLVGIYTGEAQSLKKLGVIMTQANLQDYAYAQGIKTKIADMKQAELVMLRYQYVMEKTSNAQGDFERTGGNAAGQMRQFTENMKEVGATFGEEMLPSFTLLLKDVNGILKSFGSLDDQTKKNIITFGILAAGVGPVLKVTGSLVTVGGKLTGAISNISGALGSAGGTAGLIGSLKGAIAVAGPWALAIGAMVAVVGGTVLAVDHFTTSLKELKKQASDMSTRLEELRARYQEIKDIENPTEKQKQILDGIEKEITLRERLLNIANRDVARKETGYLSEVKNPDVRSTGLIGDADNANDAMSKTIAQIDKLREKQKGYAEDSKKYGDILTQIEKKESSLAKEREKLLSATEKIEANYKMLTPAQQKQVDILTKIIAPTVKLAEELLFMDSSLDKTTESQKENAEATDGLVMSQEEWAKKLEEVNKQVNNTVDAILELDSAIATVNKGEDLNGKTLLGLIQKYPELRDKITEVNGVYKINVGALEEVKQAQMNKKDATIEDEIKSTQAVKDGVLTRIQSYGGELKSIQTIMEARSVLLDFNNKAKKTFVEHAMDGGKDYKDLFSVEKSSEVKYLRGLVGEYDEASKQLDAYANMINDIKVGVGNASAGSKESKSKTDPFQEALDTFELRKKLGKVLIDSEMAELQALKNVYAKTAEDKVDADNYMFNNYKDIMERKKYLGKLSHDQEMKMLEDGLKKFAVTEEQKAELSKRLLDTRVNQSKTWLEEQKYYNKLSLEEELAAYERIKAYSKDNADYQKQMNREIFRVQQEIRAKEVELIKKTTSDNIAARQKEYDAAVKFIDDELRKKLDSYQQQMDAINEKYANEERLEKEKEYAKKIEDLQARLGNVRTQEEFLKIADELNKTVNDRDKFYRQEQLKAEKDAIQEKMDIANKEASISKNLELEKLNNYKDAQLKMQDEALNTEKNITKNLKDQLAEREKAFKDMLAGMITLLSSAAPQFASLGQLISTSLQVKAPNLSGIVSAVNSSAGNITTNTASSSVITTNHMPVNMNNNYVVNDSSNIRLIEQGIANALALINRAKGK